ncbi:hypothetical protein GCM10022254_59890 [Actinomadura meridiana]|uniref:Uncharacterized protein n=1 Tax=Actinomadura meridiana TaxID=559626 RepID=A0ABP8CHV6_9ACTN
MSGDHHSTHPVSTHLIHGTAAGDPYVALPPTAVDATATAPTRLILAWPGFDPPRTASALAAAIPMTGVPVWRVYLDLPAAASPGGLGSSAILETEAIEAYCAAVENAVERLPAALADIRRDLGLPDGPVALAGFSAGGAAAMLAAARNVVPVTALALIAPVVAPSRVARAVEKLSGLDRAWADHAATLADRLDLGALAGDLAGRDVATLLISGSKDRVVPAREITSLRDLLRRHDTGSVQATTFRMGHALAAEPGTEARPPITEAVRVDGALTDWFRDRLARSAPVPAEEPLPPEALPIENPPIENGPIESLPTESLPTDAYPTGFAGGSPVETQTDGARPVGGDGAWSNGAEASLEEPGDHADGDARPADMVRCPPDGTDELVDQRRDRTW